MNTTRLPAHTPAGDLSVPCPGGRTDPRIVLRAAVATIVVACLLLLGVAVYSSSSGSAAQGASMITGQTTASGPTTAAAEDLVVNTSAAPTDLLIRTGGFNSTTAPLFTSASWWSTTTAYIGCITGIGVPIAVAWWVLANPWSWVAIKAGQPLPLSAGATAYNYVNWVKGKCTQFLKS